MKSIVIVLLLAAPIVAGAEIYKWTDAQGRVHFSDKPVDKNGKTEIVEVKDYKPGTDENVRQIYERNDRLRHATTEKTPKQQQALRGLPKNNRPIARRQLRASPGFPVGSSSMMNRETWCRQRKRNARAKSRNSASG